MRRVKCIATVRLLLLNSDELINQPHVRTVCVVVLVLSECRVRCSPKCLIFLNSDGLLYEDNLHYGLNDVLVQRQVWSSMCPVTEFRRAACIVVLVMSHCSVGCCPECMLLLNSDEKHVLWS